MAKPNAADHIPEDRRMEIFRALLDAQDQGINVPKSRQQVAETFGVTEAEVKLIEREGLDGQWPPL